MPFETEPKTFQFGYAFMGDYSTEGLDVELSVDNMNVGLNNVPKPKPKPKPMSLAVVRVLCGGALMCRKGLIPTMR